MPTVNLSSPDALAAPGTVNIVIVRGDDVTIRVQINVPSTRGPFDLTGWTFASKAKAEVDGDTWATASCTHNDEGGRVTVVFPHAQTALLTPDAVGVWDLQGTDADGLVRTVAAGTVTVRGDVTT